MAIRKNQHINAKTDAHHAIVIDTRMGRIIIYTGMQYEDTPCVTIEVNRDKNAVTAGPKEPVTVTEQTTGSVHRFIVMSSNREELTKLCARANKLIQQLGLNDRKRQDGGLYAHLESDNKPYVVIRDNYNATRRSFGKWPEIKDYLERLGQARQKGITNVSQVPAVLYVRDKLMEAEVAQ